MSLILKQETSGNVPTPPVGKGTIFLNDSDEISVKNSDGNVAILPTIDISGNTGVFYNDEGALATSPNLTFNGSGLNVTANLNVTGNAYISGNLTIDGNVVYVNVENLNVEDPLISLGNGANGNALTSNNGYDRGLILHNYTTQTVEAFMGWDTSNAEFAFASNVNLTNNVVSINSLGNIRAANIAGTLSTAAQTNITSVGTLTGLLVGATASQADFPNAKVILSQDNSGQTHSENIGVVGEAVADSGNVSTWGIGVLGEARANGATRATGVQGGAYVTNSADTGAAVGVRGYSSMTHSGGYNIGVLGNASGSGYGNYAFYVQAGNIGSIETATTWDLVDNNVAAINFNSTGKANIFGIETTDGAEGIYTQGYLNVTGNASVGGLKTNNLYYANGSPWDLQEAAGANTQIQFNNGVNNNFGASANFTFNNATNVLTVTGNVSAIDVTGTTLGGTLTTAAQPNITSVGSLSSLTVTGNASAGNINATTAVVASRLTSNVATGTAPLTVTSTTRVANLNVAYANVADFISVAAGTGNNFLIFANAATGNVTELTSTGITANLSNNSITATTFVGALSGAATSATTAGTVTTAAQPNITSVGTLTSVAVTGNATAGNVYANSGTIGASLLTGTLTTAAQPNITSVGVLTGLGINGNVTAANFTANTGVFTGNGNGLSSIVGANVTGTVSSATTAGTVTTAAQPNITSVGTLTSLNSSGNITASQLISNIATGTAPLVVTSTTQVANLNAATAGSADSATTAGTVTTAAQPNITSVGTLTSLTATGNVTGGNLNTSGNVNSSIMVNGGTGIYLSAGPSGYINFFTTGGDKASISDTGNITGTNVIANSTVFAGTANVSGNVNAGNVYANSGTIGASLLTGTLTTAAQPNITSVGTLSSLAVTANVAAGNLTTTGVLSVTGTGVSSIAGNLDMTSNTIINLATPTNANDAATKQYVDDVAQGLHTHDSCNAATQTTLATISGGTVTYNNGTSGVGATLTTTGSYTTIDGVTLSNGMRILVKNEANTAHNGIYDRTSTTVLTRSDDFNTPTEMAGGDFTFVTAGTLYDNTGWVMPDAVTTVGTSPVVWVQFSGAGTYTAGTGLTLTGTEFSVNASQTQVTSVGTLTGLNSSGTITAPAFTANTGVFTGNGSALTALNASNVSSGTLAQARLANSNVILGSTTLELGTTTTTIAGLSSVTSTTFVGALTGAATTAGTVTTAAQPNITSVGTLTSVAVTGNANVGNLNATTAVVASTLTSNVATGTAPLTVTSTTRVANLNVNYANVADFISVAAGTGNNFLIFANAATGNITELTSTGLIANLSNNSITATTFVGALSGAATSATTAGTVTIAAQGNITSVGTLTGLGVNGTVTAVNITANTGVFTGNGAALTTLNASNISSGTLAQARLANASLTVNGTAISLGGSGTVTATATNALTIGSGLGGTSYNGSSPVTITNTGVTSIVAGTNIAVSGATGAVTVNVTGTVANATFATSAGSAGSATTAGTVTTAAQPNITSVGTLTSLAISGTNNLTVRSITTGANTTAGTITGNFTLSTGSRLNATYADLAEKYVADAEYEPGTVLEFGGEQEVSLSNTFDSTRVAGVVTTNPAYTMNDACEGEHVATIALQGRVPVKVHGPVSKGDLLVSGTNGYAIANNNARAGTIIGKSLENFSGTTGIIEVAVGRF